MGKEKLRKYRKSWEKESWAKGWLKDATDDKNSYQDAYCSVCKVYLRAHKTDLTKHGSKERHMKLMRNLNCIQHGQATLSRHIKTVTNKDKENALRIAVHIAMHSSIRSVDHLGELFNKIYDNNLKLHRTKCTKLITYVISPSLLDELLVEIGNQYYSLIIDESTDVSIRKYMCICIRYFSVTKETITINFLGLVEVEKTTAVELHKTLKTFLQSVKLDIQRLIGLGTDGASNMCGKKESLFVKMREDNPKIQIVRCICHSINLASSKAADVLPSNIDYLCREIYNWFSCSPLRRLEYQRLLSILNGNEKKFHNFVRLSTTRWLCRYNVVKTILEDYEELQVHFHTVVNKERCYAARVLNDMLQDISNYLYLKILEPILLELNKLNIIFQKNFVEAGSAYDDIERLILFLAEKIFTPAYLDHGILTILTSVDNPLAFRKPEDVDLGIGYYRALQTVQLESEKIKDLQVRATNYIKTLIIELKQRLPDNMKHFKGLQALSPKICLSQSLRLKFHLLPFIDIFIDEKELSAYETEYNLLFTVDWENLYGLEALCDSYKFWPIVLKHKSAGDVLVFQNIATFALTLLALPMSNAVVERVFGYMNTTKTKLRNKMSLQVLNAILMIKTSLYTNNKCCVDFVPNKKMFDRFTNEMYKIDDRDNANVEELSYILELNDNVNDF